jgi:aryl-alcohol dehydrogenase-like predicted oxidoreductase
VDLVQVPVNILDQRLIRSGHLAKLKKAGVEIHARSVFLQGLLLMHPEEVSPFFAPVLGKLRDFRLALDDAQITPRRAALRFVDSLPEIDAVICGINTCDQLEELICDLNAVQSGLNSFPFEKFALDDENILNPSKWKL